MLSLVTKIGSDVQDAIGDAVDVLVRTQNAIPDDHVIRMQATDTLRSLRSAQLDANELRDWIEGAKIADGTEALPLVSTVKTGDAREYIHELRRVLARIASELRAADVTDAASVDVREEQRDDCLDRTIEALDLLYCIESEVEQLRDANAEADHG